MSRKQRSGLSGLLVFAAVLALATVASAGPDGSPEIKRLIADAGMAPWTWRPISLDMTLRDTNGAAVSLRQFSRGDPMLVYMYGYW